MAQLSVVQEESIEGDRHGSWIPAVLDLESGIPDRGNSVSPEKARSPWTLSWNSFAFSIEARVS